MAALRRAIPAEPLNERSRLACERILAMEWFQAAESVALFWPIIANNELDLRAVDTAARHLGKRIYYPFLAGEGETVRTGFRLVEDLAALCERGRGFREPAENSSEARPGDLNLIFVPALAAAPNGHRLGYGAGFYDVTLPEFCPPARSVVVVFDFQLVQELPVSEFDVACNAVLTDKRLVCASEPAHSN